MIQALPFPKQISEIVHSHHERWDGTGYPDGLVGEDIPYLARIVGLGQLCSTTWSLDMITKGLWPSRKLANTFRREAGKGIDPTLANLFAKVVW